MVWVVWSDRLGKGVGLEDGRMRMRMDGDDGEDGWVMVRVDGAVEDGGVGWMDWGSEGG